MSFALHLLIIGSLVFFLVHKAKQIESHESAIDTSLYSAESTLKGASVPVKTTPLADTNAEQAVDSASNSPEKSSGNEQNALSGENQNYFSAMRAKIEAQKIYPNLARKQNVEGVVEIALALNANGEIREIRPISGLNHAVLVQAALQAIQAAAPFSAVPKGFPQRVIIPIEFTLSKKNSDNVKK